MSIRTTIAGWCALVCLLTSGCVGWQSQSHSSRSRLGMRTGDSPVQAWPSERSGDRPELAAQNASPSDGNRSRHGLTQPGTQAAQLPEKGFTSDRSATSEANVRRANPVTGDSPAAEPTTAAGTPLQAFSTNNTSLPARSASLNVAAGTGEPASPPTPPPAVTSSSADALPSEEPGRLVASVNASHELVPRSPVYASVSDQGSMGVPSGPSLGDAERRDAGRADAAANPASRLASEFIPTEIADPPLSNLPLVEQDGTGPADAEGEASSPGESSRGVPRVASDSAPPAATTLSPEKPIGISTQPDSDPRPGFVNDLPAAPGPSGSAGDAPGSSVPSGPSASAGTLPVRAPTMTSQFAAPSPTGSPINATTTDPGSTKPGSSFASPPAPDFSVNDPRLSGPISPTMPALSQPLANPTGNGQPAIGQPGSGQVVQGRFGHGQPADGQAGPSDAKRMVPGGPEAAMGQADAAWGRPGQPPVPPSPRRNLPAGPALEPLSAPVPPSIPLGVTRGQDAGWVGPQQPGLPARQLPPPPAAGQPLQTLDGQPLFVNPYPLDPPPSALPLENGQPLPPPLDFDVYVDETRTGRFMFGAGVNSDLGVTGQIVVEERNFDWRQFPTSFSDIVNGTAWRGAGQGFRFEAMPGTQVQRYLVSFTQPYLYLPGIPDPLSLNLSGSYFNRNFFDWDEERLGGRVGLGYRLTHDLSLTTSFRAENVKIYNPRVLGNPQLDEVLGNNDLFSGRVGLTHDTRDQPFAPTEGHLIELSYEQTFGSFDYPRAELDFRQYFLMRERPDGSGRHTLGFSFRTGVSGSQTPIMERFFAGGFSTLRGFDFRGASPVGVGGVIVGGDFSFLGSVEYMFPLTADDMMRGVVFCDFGTIEENIEFRSDNYRVAPGAGLRIAVPALGPAPLALDFAFPVAKAETDQEQIFSFFFGFGR